MSPRTKFGNVETSFGTMKFDSKLEAQRYSELIGLQYAKRITSLKTQVPIELQPAFRTKDGKAIRAIHYIADFIYRETATGKTVVEETKGFQTDVSKIKMKMLQYAYPEYEVRMVYAKKEAKKTKAGFGHA